MNEETRNKISIIIPVYNVSDFIDECIQSLLKQTYKNYEIILVDDGSTDDSGFKCDGYAQKYANIKIIHQINSGVSYARNVGISKSTGDYIVFVDPDDTNSVCHFSWEDVLL